MKKSLLILTLFNLATYISSGQTCFSSATSFPVGTQPYSIVNADFNADGKIDLATSNYGSNNISILLGNGAGGFAAATNFATGAYPNLTSGDFNGDGKTDLATANSSSNNISILLGNGLGAFSAPTNFAVGPGTYPTFISCADFNGDGKMDLVTANYTSSNISVLSGNGLGGFSAPTNFTVGTNPRFITCSDFNGDGKTDLAVANGGAWVLLNNGAGGFSAAVNYSLAGPFLSITSADYTGDGLMDLAAVNSSRNVSILPGNGLGSFSAGLIFAIGGAPYSLSSADMNGDGKMDLATPYSVITGNGSGSFSVATNFTIPGVVWSGTCADFNGDGKMDLAGANYEFNKVDVWLGIRTDFSISQVNLNCKGDNNGSATVTMTCGAPPYSYLWNTSPLQTTATATGLSGGTYTITVTDASGAAKTGTVTITEPLTAISISTSQTDITCNGGNNGSATATVTGGTPPYTYSWNTSPIKTTATASNLPPGNYIITVTDSKACLISSSVTFTEPPILSVSTTKNDVSCNGGSDGSATAFVTGGISPYAYSWNSTPMQTTATAINLSAGNVLLFVTDFIGCVKTINLTLTAPTAVSVSATKTDLTCNPTNQGSNDGTATASVTGGTPPYTYLWNSFPAQTASTALNLSDGTYTVTVTDFLGCIKTTNVTINNPLGMSASSSSTVNTKCSGACDGTLALTVYNGIYPFAYQWDASTNNQTNDIAYDLCAGVYNVTITDANGCIFIHQAFVNMMSIVDPNVYLTNLAAVDQINVSPSFAAYYTYNLPATINANPANPRNFVDPGKKARFKVECKNQKITGQSIVSGICKVRSNNPYITITDSSSALNNIGWNNKAWSADEFEIDIDPNTPPGTNAYIDFIVQESGQDYSTSCISIPITPLVYSQTTPYTIDDDNNPDSQGNDNDSCEPNEIIEFYPWLDNISTLNAEYVRGRFENLDNHSFINIWNGVPGVGTTVYDAGWWNYAFAQPQTINAFNFNTTPEYDFVFNYNNSNLINDFKLYMVMAGGFNLFSGNVLSLVQWTLPYTFNSTSTTSVGSESDNKEDLKIYPNPTSGNVQFSIGTEKIQKLSIYNQLGALIYQSEKEISELNLTGYPKGVYFIQGQSANKVFNKKLIIH